MLAVFNGIAPASTLHVFVGPAEVKRKGFLKTFISFVSELPGRRQPPLLADSDGTRAGDLSLLFSGVRGDTPGCCQVRRLQLVRRRLSGGDRCSSGSSTSSTLCTQRRRKGGERKGKIMLLHLVEWGFGHLCNGS